MAVRAGVLSEKADGAKLRNEAFVEGSDGWRFLPSELRFADKLAAQDIGTMAQPAVDAISDFSAKLEQAGIALFVVPVPPKVLVHAPALGVDAGLAQSMRDGWNIIMTGLGNRGVRVIDLLPEYSAAKEPMFCLRDTHWSGAGIAAAVERLSPMLQEAGVSTRAFSDSATPWKHLSIHGDLGGDPETVKLRFPQTTSPQEIQSEVLLLGDSHVLVFHQGGELHTTGAGLPEQMSVVLGAMPEVMGVRGSGATSSRMQLARTIRSKPEYLRTKKIIVWVFAGREFTEADMWRKIPLSASGSH